MASGKGEVDSGFPSESPGHEQSQTKTVDNLKSDIQRKLRFYRSDFTDGLNSKTVGTVIFLYFAVLANAVAFGALSGVLTHQQIGISEMLVVTAVGGIIFALFSGQPLTILGGTGPIAIFTGILYTLCERLELPFLGVYAWVGIWAGLFLLISAFTAASNIMKYFTRFTDEIFVVLVSLIFIHEALKNISESFEQSERATAFLTLILALGTFMIARGLKRTIGAPYLTRWMREFLSDFGPTIAVISMTMVALSFPDVTLELPAVPEKIAPTSRAEWLIDMRSLPNWAIFGTIIPGLMAAILLFLDQNITTRLVNSKQFRLKKGGGYHLDMLVVSLLVIVSSLFGLPWIVAATVHSINHVKSLAQTQITEESGRRKEVVVGVQENRLSNLLIHFLIGCSLYLLDLIRVIPMPVLFGLFLYMGFTSLLGNGFYERLMLWITDPRLYPDTHFTKYVSPRTRHIYTAVQCLCTGILWILKSSRLGILFPLLLAGLEPLRLFLRKYFEPKEFDLLTAEHPEDYLEGKEIIE